MKMKYVWPVLIAMGLISCMVCKTQGDEVMVPTNSSWHMIKTNNMTPELRKQLFKQFGRTNIPFIIQPFRDGWAWTTNAEELWRGIWAEGTNGMRTQLKIINDYTNCLIRVQVGSFTLKREPGSQCLDTPNGKFASFELSDSSGHIIPPKPTAGTNMLEAYGTVYRTNPPAWALPSAGSLVADFPEKVSTNAWPLYYKGGGLAPGGHLSGYGIAEQICSLNLYDLYSITNAGDYTLTIQPVLYLHKSYDSEFLDRIDFPIVTTKVHLVAKVK